MEAVSLNTIASDCEVYNGIVPPELTTASKPLSVKNDQV
jgi:hypothetical protein